VRGDQPQRRGLPLEKRCGASSLQHALTFVALAFWFIFIAGWIVKNGTLQE